ncbi:copper homeostasis protein CutC [Agarivorans sp. MS3-6]
MCVDIKLLKSLSHQSLEICCYSLDDIESAIRGGADRIEFCAGQNDGGVTPSYGALKQAQKYLKQLPIVVMVRPRGGDFCYLPDEIEQMIRDIELIKELGYSGVVTGCLSPDASLDVAANQKLVDACGDTKVTFHRAFDCVAAPIQAAQLIADIGFNRVLSSGQSNNIEGGLPLLLELQDAQPALEWIAAGGVRAHNIQCLVNKGLRFFHSAAAKPLNTLFDTRYSLAMAASKDLAKELSRQTVDTAQVLAMADLLTRA